MNIGHIKIGMRVTVKGIHPETEFGMGTVIREELANDLHQGGVVDKDTRQWHHTGQGRWVIKLDNNPFSYDTTLFFGKELTEVAA